MSGVNDPYTFHIDGEVADRITGKWLMRHLDFAKATLADEKAHEDDKVQAEKDIRSFRRVLWYLTGDLSYADATD